MAKKAAKKTVTYKGPSMLPHSGGMSSFVGDQQIFGPTEAGPDPAGFNNMVAEMMAAEAAPSTYDGGSGAGSGGTYAMEAPAPRELASSPEWLAYLSSLGMEETQFRGDIEKQRGMARATADQQLGDIAFSGTGERRNIAGGLESRGMARSGQFVRSLAEQRAREGRQSSNVELGLANTVGGLESSLASKLMDLASRRAQQELSMRASGYS